MPMPRTITRLPGHSSRIVFIGCGLFLALFMTSWGAWTLHESHPSGMPKLTLQESRRFNTLREGSTSSPPELLLAERPRQRLRPPQHQEEEDAVHIVFSTDCSGYQHWQGIAFWYAAQSAGHAGPVTRIASGCTAEQETAIEEEWRKIDRGKGRFRVHFTPHMELNIGKPGGKYPYSNKPGGLHHWLTHAKITENLLCLLDPDMLLLKPLTVFLTEGLELKSRKGRSGSGAKHSAQVEFADTQGVGRVLATSASSQDLQPRVCLGSPAGQHFGIGGAWARAGTAAAAARSNAWASFSKGKVCGEGNPCTLTTFHEADRHFSVGPVYLAHKSDWERIAAQWWAMVPLVASMYIDVKGRPQLLSEMYALTMAVANLSLPWSQVSSYMVSDPKTQSPTEAWNWIEDIALDSPAGAAAVCLGAQSSGSLPFATRDRHALALPSALHYCQKYEAAGHVFAKHRMPHDFFSCGGEPLPFNASAIIEDLFLRDRGGGESGKEGALAFSGALRTAFMLCHLIPLTNAALDAYKRDVCSV